MKTRFTLDVVSKTLTRSVLGAEVPSALVGVLAARDKMELEVVLTAGVVNKTEEVLVDGTLLKVGVRAQPSKGDPLAVSSGVYTLVDGVANLTLNLDTVEMQDFINGEDNAVSVPVYFEIELSTGDGLTRNTLLRKEFVVQGEVIPEAGSPTPVGPPGLITPVDMPVSTASPGEVGQFSVNGDQMAVYVSTVGWVFFTGFQV